MSGGRLVLLDRLGRDARAFPLAEGLATIGSDPGCDIRLLLPTVSPHHATVVVHANQTVVSSMAAGELLVNGAPTGMAALRHGDQLTVGGRTLRWDYEDPLSPGSERRGRGGRVRRRHSAQPRAAPPAQPRASMPASSASSSGKQVAVVQPQRRDAGDGVREKGSPGRRRARLPLHHSHRSSPGARLKDTKASLWIESRKRPRVTKIRAPARIGPPVPPVTPVPPGPPRYLPDQIYLSACSLVSLRHGPAAEGMLRRVRRLVAALAGWGRRLQGYLLSSADHTKQAALMLMAGHTPRPKGARHRSLAGLAGLARSRAARRHTSSGVCPAGRTPRGDGSPIFQSSMPGPKKSSLKNPSIKRGMKKSESIKFDLSNLEQPDARTASDEELSLHYSDSPESPSPRRALHSRSGRMLHSLGASLACSPADSPAPQRSGTALVCSPTRKSSRGSLILERALGNSTFDVTRSSRSTIETLSDQSYRTTFESARKSRTRSSRVPNQNLEAYSIVDLVSSVESDETGGSVYGSAGSRASSQPARPPPLCSTPRAGPEGAAPLATPENTRSLISLNGTRISRASRSRSRINDIDSLVPDGDGEDASPRSSRRTGKSELASPILGKAATDLTVEGTDTPEERCSPEEATTPVLRIQNFLNLSSSGQSSRTSGRLRRLLETAKLAGGAPRRRKTPRSSIKSRSLLATSKRASRMRQGYSNCTTGGRLSGDEDEAVTPTSAIKPVQEGVKNKHSTAKKTQSKRSIIDNLDESELVKQLFNSPVKRKLSQSMTEFSRKKLFEDEDDESARTSGSAVGPRTPDVSMLERTEVFTPGVFVSPLSTPGRSPNVAGLKRLFVKNTPENDLRNVKGLRALLRSPRTRRSIRNDLTDVSGVTEVFDESPKYCLSDVRVKELFTSLPKNDLRRVSGVKSLFRLAERQHSPKNSLENLAGVKELFQNSPLNDLQNVSGVKSTIRLHSPRNDLTDVRGLKRMFRGDVNTNNLSDVSGVEELFQESQNSDSTFDQLKGELNVRSYPKSKSLTKTTKPKRRRNAKSLHDSISLITDNVEEWLENELKKRFRRDENESLAKRSLGKSNLTRELQKLTTDTVEGSAPLLASRSRNGTLTRSGLSEASQRKKSASEIYSAHTLPIKKRSLLEANRNSANASRTANRLPIKKRMLVHSTPVKGRVSLNINASELGRVSPIASVGKAADITLATVVSPKTKKGKSSPMECENSESVKVSFKKTSGTRPSENSPDHDDGQTLGRYSRRNTKVILASNTRKRRVSVTKKMPVLAPKPNTESINCINEDVKNKIKSNQINKTKSQVEEKSIKLRKIRANVGKKDATVSGSANQTRGILQSKTVIKTPRNTRAKSRKGSVVYKRLSMKLKPQNVQGDTIINEIENDQGSRADVRSPLLPTPTENVYNTNESRRTRYGNKKTSNVTHVVRKQPKRNQTGVIPKVSKEKNSGDPKLPKADAQIAGAVDNNLKVTSGKVVAADTIAAQTENTMVRTTRRTRNKQITLPVIQPSVDVAAVPRTRRRQGKDVDALKLTKDKSKDNIVTGRARRGAKMKEIVTDVEASASNNTERNTNANDNTRKTRKNVVKAKSQEDVKSARTRRGLDKGNVAENGVVKASGAMRTAKDNDKAKNIDERNMIKDTDTEPIVGKRTRRTRKVNNIGNIPTRGKNLAKEAPASTPVGSEEAVGSRTRSARAAARGERTAGSKARPTTARAAAGAQSRTASVRGRNKKMDAEEAEGQVPEGRPRRGARAAAGKRAHDTPSGEEAPAKRQRTTRAAAATSADGRSRNRSRR